METKIVYKITNEKGLSFITSECSIKPYFEENFILKYELGKITKPKKGKIFCFKNFEDAKDFAGTKPHRIYECEAKISKRQRKLRIGMEFMNAENLLDYWIYYEKVLKYDSVTHPILRTMTGGTVLCDWVKPIKLIEEVI